MCEFCKEHGDGQKWYFNANNYATELLDDLSRKKMIQYFYHETYNDRTITLMEKRYGKKSILLRMMSPLITRRNKGHHFGQVVPIEDVWQILDLAKSTVRVACGCRWALEKKEGRYCIGIALGPPEWWEEMDMDYFGSPDVARLENLTTEEAKKFIKETENDGMVHTIWTFKTPFIGAVCNCNLSYCFAMRGSIGLGLQTMFRGEYIAKIDTEKCKGCKACEERCQFEAIVYMENEKKCFIDPTECYGCGVCRSFCKEDAIAIVSRSEHPVAKSVW